MAKTKKVKYSSVMVYANARPISRITDISIDADLNEEEIREIGNEEIVERVDQTPTVSLTINTNEYANISNLRFLTGVSGGNIVVDSFDGPTIDVTVMLEEDKVLARTAYFNECYPTSISWNFDVGGLAQESISLETDNWTWFLNSHKITRVFNAIPGLSTATGAVFYLNALDRQSSAAAWVGAHSGCRIYVDGQIVNTGGEQDCNLSQYGTTGFELNVLAANMNPNVPYVSGGSNIRGLVYMASSFGLEVAQTRIKSFPWGVTSGGASAIGGVSKGMIDIVLVTGGYSVIQDISEGTTNFLRLQTLTADVDLARETLEELGHDRAIEKTLTLPVTVNLTMSALASDLEEFAKFTGLGDHTNSTALSISDFGKNTSIAVRIYDAKDTTLGARNLRKTLVITGIDISNLSFSTDVGGNATQDFTGAASNFLVSGADWPTYLS